MKQAEALIIRERLEELYNWLDERWLDVSEVEDAMSIVDRYISPRNRNPIQIMTWNTQENYNRLSDSAKMGGSFSAAIIDAFFKADNTNKPRLVEAFPEIFKP